MRKGSIAWYIKGFLDENKGKSMHYGKMLHKLKKKKTLKGSTPTATLLSVLIRNKQYFLRTKRGYYKLNNYEDAKKII